MKQKDKNIKRRKSKLTIIIVLILTFCIVRSVGMSINNRTPERGINESMYVDINGTKQWINIYGQDKTNPVLLYLHGGPGAATSPIDYVFTRKWSDVYTVVTWDQRNSGKSYDKDNVSEKITKDIMIEDGVEMTTFLINYLKKDRITLLGHSWGSIYGANLVLDYPEYYEAFIGTGQCIDIDENEQRLYEAAGKWTEGDSKGKEILAGWSPDNDDTIDALKARTKIMKRYGYDMMKDGRDYNIVTTLMFNPNYTLKDYIEYIKSVEVSMEPYMDFFSNGLTECSLKERYKYEVPYYNINGDMDYQTNYELACEYFKKVNAPDKKMYVMKDGTHGLLESRSEEFSEYLHDIAHRRTMFVGKNK